MVVTRTLALLLVLVAALAVAACGAGEPARPGGGADEPRAVRLPGAVAHATILGLDLDPADRSLYLQTSLGLVARAAPRRDGRADRGHVHRAAGQRPGAAATRPSRSSGRAGSSARATP